MIEAHAVTVAVADQWRDTTPMCRELSAIIGLVREQVHVSE